MDFCKQNRALDHWWFSGRRFPEIRLDDAKARHDPAWCLISGLFHGFVMRVPAAWEGQKVHRDAFLHFLTRSFDIVSVIAFYQKLPLSLKTCRKILLRSLQAP